VGGVFDRPGGDEKCIQNFSTKSKVKFHLKEVIIINGS
jgi:hypothetical protein